VSSFPTVSPLSAFPYQEPPGAAETARATLVPHDQPLPGLGRAWSDRIVGGRRYGRAPIRTRWLDADADLVAVLIEHLPDRRPDDTVAVSEKVAVLLTGRAVPIDSIRPGRLAQILARGVRPQEGSEGLSVPEKMEYVLRTCGRFRILAAALAGAVTRPIGMRGLFYRLAGSIARDLDGGRPPYEHLLFPPLDEQAAQQLCGWLERALRTGVAIIDLNDFGGSVRATSPMALPSPLLTEVLADNPLRQRLTGTPFALVRPIA
jgi:hypothetical protein